jgi:hypothetical protein
MCLPFLRRGKCIVELSGRNPVERFLEYTLFSQAIAYGTLQNLPEEELQKLSRIANLQERFSPELILI